MASNSGRKSSSSGRSTERKKVVISAQQTSHVRHSKAAPKAKASPKRKPKPASPVRGSGVAAAAQRKANSKRDLRERRLADQRVKSRLILLGVAAVVLAVVVGSIALYRSSIFLITKVEVMGNTQLTADEVRTLAAVPPRATLLRFPAKEVAQRVSDSSWVRSVSVTRDFPDTMRIRVTEFVPSALVDSGGDVFWLVDSGGWVIAQQPQETTSTLITIRDLESFEASVGERSTSEALRNALRVWKALSSELRAKTRTISAPSVDKTALMTTDDIAIFMGSSEDIERKDLVARRILEEQAGKVVSINVRTVDRPTWRGVDTE